jgi:hypothetical protein
MELERDRELEAVGLGIAPGLTGDDRTEFVERAGIGAGQPRRARPRRALQRSWSMMRSGVRQTGVGCMLRSGCLPTGGSATR